VALRRLSPCIVDEDAAHGFRGDSQEMSATAKIANGVGARELQPRLVDERGGLQGLAGFLALETSCGKAAKLIVHEQDELST
jgi:hypothetical protein